MPGNFVAWTPITQSPNNATSAVWGLFDHLGVPVDISQSQTCGFQEFINLVAQGWDGVMGGGPVFGTAPNGIDPAIAFLSAPVDIPAMEKGRIIAGAVTLQATHTGPYVLRHDSVMAYSFDWRGGQIVTNPAAPNQIGYWHNPRSALPADTHGPVSTMTDISLPSIVCATGNGQICALLDATSAPIQGVKFSFIEPNGGDYGVAVLGGTAHGFTNCMVDVMGAHGQKYVCLDMGHGSGAAIKGGIVRATLHPGPGCTGLDVWSQGIIYEYSVQSLGGQALRGVTLEASAAGNKLIEGLNDAASPRVFAPGQPGSNIFL